MSVTARAGIHGIRVDPGEVAGDFRIALDGPLDGRCGRLLLQAAQATSAAGGSRLTVDLRRINAFTADGVSAASICCREAKDLPRGVSFVASDGPSRGALLAILKRQ